MSAEDQPPKKKYEKPTLSEVALRPEEAVLGNCKSASDLWARCMSRTAASVGRLLARWARERGASRSTSGACRSRSPPTTICRSPPRGRPASSCARRGRRGRRPSRASTRAGAIRRCRRTPRRCSIRARACGASTARPPAPRSCSRRRCSAARPIRRPPSARTSAAARSPCASGRSPGAPRSTRCTIPSTRCSWCTSSRAATASRSTGAAS